MQQTSKEFTFEAAHQTPPFSNLHGHSFTVEVLMSGPADPIYGWSHNLDEVEPVIEAVRKQLDHRYLNDVEGLSVPTLENVAHWLWIKLNAGLKGIVQIKVRRGQPGNTEACIYSGQAA